MIVECLSCGIQNRLPDDFLATSTYRCGSCKILINPSSDAHGVMNGDAIKEADERLKRIAEVGVANTIVEDVLILLGYKHPRRFKNTVQAMIYGWEPKSLNDIEIMEVQSVVHSVVMASDNLGAKIKEDPSLCRSIGISEFNKILIEGLSTPYTGGWFYEHEMPRGWTSCAKHGDEFVIRTTFPIQLFAVPHPLEIVVATLLRTFQAS